MPDDLPATVPVPTIDEWVIDYYMKKGMSREEAIEERKRRREALGGKRA